MNRKIWFGLAGLALVAVIAGAAFMAMRLLNAKAAGGSGLALGLPLGGLTGGKGPAMQSIRIDMERAPELPPQQADFSGQVTGIQDNSIFIAAMSKGGAVYMSGNSGKGSQGSQDPPVMPTPDGPSTEVVITRDTQIYRDVSFENVPRPSANSPSETISVQQKVEPAALADVSTESVVQVWGQKRGGRLIADVILIFGPMIIKK